MRKNTLNYKEFFVISLFWNITSFILYRITIFKTIGSMSKIGSLAVLVGIVVGLFVINFFISGKWGKNDKAIVTTIIPAYGIYTLITNARDYQKVYAWVGIVTGISMLAVPLFLMRKKTTNIRNRQKLMRKRNRQFYVAVRTIFACAGIAVMLLLLIPQSVVGRTSSSQVKGTAVYGDEYSLANNIDMFLYLQPEEWDKLGDDLETKLAVLSTALNTEGRYLGFTKKVTLYALDMDEGTLGYYSANQSAIYLDRNHILKDSSREVLESLLHECFHCIQMEYVDLYNSLSDEYKNMYFFLDAKEYAKEFDNYVGESNFYHYYMQSCESAARGYGKSSAQTIFDRIEEYLEDNRRD